MWVSSTSDLIIASPVGYGMEELEELEEYSY